MVGGAMIGLVIRTTPTIDSDVESSGSWWSKIQIRAIADVLR
jgi:hypothetical protein